MVFEGLHPIYDEKALSEARWEETFGGARLGGLGSMFFYRDGCLRVGIHRF